MIWLYSILSVLIVSLVSLIGLFTFSLRTEALKKIIFIIISLSIGALFGDVFIHIIPEVFAEGILPQTFSISIIAGILVFFILEKFLRWHHSHEAHIECADCDPVELEEKQEKESLGAMILLADGLHNFLDGIIIGLSFLVSIPVGIATVIAVVLHEIPQEVSDFGLLLHAGFSRSRALFLNFLSALTAVAGVVLALLVGKALEEIISIGLAAAAGGFIYIAGSDLVPELHKVRDFKKSSIQVLAITVGFLLMFALLLIE